MLKNQNSALGKCNFCTQGLQWCSDSDCPEFCTQKVEILCLENWKFPQCHGKCTSPRFSAPNRAIPCSSQNSVLNSAIADLWNPGRTDTHLGIGVCYKEIFSALVWLKQGPAWMKLVSYLFVCPAVHYQNISKSIKLYLHVCTSDVCYQNVSNSIEPINFVFRWSPSFDPGMELCLKNCVRICVGHGHFKVLVQWSWW